MQEQLPRRKKGRIAGYVTLFTTQTMDKKTGKLGIFFAGNRLKAPVKISSPRGRRFFDLIEVTLRLFCINRNGKHFYSGRLPLPFPHLLQQ